MKYSPSRKSTKVNARTVRRTVQIASPPRGAHTDIRARKNRRTGPTARGVTVSSSSNANAGALPFLSSIQQTINRHVQLTTLCDHATQRTTRARMPTASNPVSPSANPTSNQDSTITNSSFNSMSESSTRRSDNQAEDSRRTMAIVNEAIDCLRHDEEHTVDLIARSRPMLPFLQESPLRPARRQIPYIHDCRRPHMIEQDEEDEENDNEDLQGKHASRNVNTALKSGAKQVIPRNLRTLKMTIPDTNTSPALR